jgi:hypothetical protein
MVALQIKNRPNRNNAAVWPVFFIAGSSLYSQHDTVSLTPHTLKVKKVKFLA